MFWRCFQSGFTEKGRPMLNVGSTTWYEGARVRRKGKRKHICPLAQLPQAGFPCSMQCAFVTDCVTWNRVKRNPSFLELLLIGDFVTTVRKVTESVWKKKMKHHQSKKDWVEFQVVISQSTVGTKWTLIGFVWCSLWWSLLLCGTKGCF